MAHALRKLLRHSSDHDHHGDKAAEGSGGGNGSPSDAARRLLARACRDGSKVSPAESSLNNNNNNNHNLNNGPSTVVMHSTHHPPLGKTKGQGFGGVGGSGNGVGNGSGGSGGGGGGSGGALSRASSFFRAKKHHLMAESTIQHAKLVRTRRLMKEFQEMCKQQRESDNPVFTVELVEDNLFEWNVKLHKVDPESDLYRDMQEMSTPYVLLNLTFPDNFPFAPPFMRVITPRIEKGFVMEGGAICMELLTPRGWASAYTVEAVIMQFAASLVKGQGRIARKHKGNKEFNKKSAEASFRSLVKTHEKYGWVTPPLSDG